MLILTRYEGQRIFVDGKRIEVRVLEIDPKLKRVSIGFVAEKDISISRSEIYDKYQPNQ